MMKYTTILARFEFADNRGRADASYHKKAGMSYFKLISVVFVLLLMGQLRHINAVYASHMG